MSATSASRAATPSPESLAGPDHALHVGATVADVDVMWQALNAGAKVNCANENGRTALIWSCLCGHAAAATWLLEKGADIDQVDEIGDTPLMWACRGGHAEVVDILIDRKANVNRVSKGGDTALMQACNRGHSDCAKLLCDPKRGCAAVNRADRGGSTALLRAARGGHHECIKVLLGRNASIDVEDYDGDTPLLASCRGGHTESVRLLCHGDVIFEATTAFILGLSSLRACLTPPAPLGTTDSPPSTGPSTPRMSPQLR